MDNDIYDSYSILEDSYNEKLRKLQDENMRTGIDNSEEYERIRSNYVIEMTMLDARRAVSRIN